LLFKDSISGTAEPKGIGIPTPLVNAGTNRKRTMTQAVE
jgi:hypothetical protein